MDQTGIEPAASEVQAQHSTNELQARVLVSPTAIRSFDWLRWKGVADRRTGDSRKFAGYSCKSYVC